MVNIVVQLDDGKKISVAAPSENLRQIVDRIIEFGVREEESGVFRHYLPHRIAVVEIDHGKR